MSSTCESVQSSPHHSIDSSFTVQEQLRLCLKPSYKPRRVRDNGAYLVLLWNFLIINSVHYFMTSYVDIGGEEGWQINDYFSAGQLVVFSLLLPLSDWLADSYIGRYKIIRCGIWIMWISSVLATLSTVIAQLIGGHFEKVNNKVLV